MLTLFRFAITNGTPMFEARPLALSDEQLTMILNAAAPLQQVDRDPFLRGAGDSAARL
jgi:hypothetical protein